MNRDNTGGQPLVMVLVMGLLLKKTCTVSCKPKFWIQKQETLPFKHDSLGQNRNVRGDIPAVPSNISNHFYTNCTRLC